ncbi:uncharacterized protein LOC121812416 [Haplochromis burtoni]|uniref:uncharacterized protein LOC121812416 n=1 Tax=Haplochromis burtoni TaxID=8153 RepID=UPI001C2D46EF|nr:uncharacterized protein LOC121812416 [Haplochromis burtoni]
MSQRTSASMKTRSNISGSSRHTRSSAASKAAAAQARAEAEAAKAEAAFVDKENDLKLQQAELEASMQLRKIRLEASLDKVRMEKRAAAAEAKAEVLEAAAIQDDGEGLSEIDVPADDPVTRTREYVKGASHGSQTTPILETSNDNTETKLLQHSPTIDSYSKIFTPGSDVHFRPSLKPVATPHIQTQTTPIIANLKDHFPGKADQSETYTPKQEPTPLPEAWELYRPSLMVTITIAGKNSAAVTVDEAVSSVSYLCGPQWCTDTK